jgi:hypothetical protein
MAIALESLYAQHAWAERIVDDSTLAALTFLVWDALTTLDEEVEWIWRWVSSTLDVRTGSHLTDVCVR